MLIVAEVVGGVSELVNVAIVEARIGRLPEECATAHDEEAAQDDAGPAGQAAVTASQPTSA